MKNNDQLLSSREIIQPIENKNKADKQTIDNNDFDHDNDDLEAYKNCNETSAVNYKCSVCPYKCSQYSLAQRHVLLHLTSQGIVCPLCSYTTSSQNSMIHHMNIVHPTSQTVVKFPSATQITNANIIQQYRCSSCSYQCESFEALNLHRRLEHDDEEFDIDSSSSVGADDNEDEANNDATNLPVDRNNNIFQCPICTPSNTNNYSNLEQFTIHIFTNHNDDISNNQSCPFCSFIAHTTSKYTLTEHIGLHFNGTLVQPDPILGIENVKELLIE